MSFELVAQERRTIVSPKNGESNSNKESLDHYRKFSYSLKDISLLNGNRVKISGKDNAFAILDELNVVLFFASNPNPNAMENKMGDFAGRYEITFKINPVIYVNNKPVPFTEAVDYEKSIEVKLYGLHRLVAKTNGSVNRESKIVDAAAFLYGSMIVDINSLTQREKGYNKGMIPRYMAIFGTNDPREAFRLYKAGWGIDRPSVPVALELQGLTFKGDYAKQKEQSLQIKTAKAKDDFWDSPTNEVAETKKSRKDDFWDSPTVVANSNENKNIGVKMGTFIDKRDGKTYKWVDVNSRKWMTSDLKYDAGVISELDFYKKNGDYCYSYETAQKVCPEGWRLPTIEDINQIIISKEKSQCYGEYSYCDDWNYKINPDFYDEFSSFQNNENSYTVKYVPLWSSDKYKNEGDQYQSEVGFKFWIVESEFTSMKIRSGYPYGKNEYYFNKVYFYPSTRNMTVSGKYKFFLKVRCISN